MVSSKVGGLVRLVAVALLAAACTGARAIAIWPSMPGSWAGFSQSSLLPAVQLPAVQFEVRSQSGGRFAGVLLLPAVQLPAVQFFCDGSVQPSPKPPSPNRGSEANVFGLSTDGGLILVMHGRTVAMGDGSVHLISLAYGVFGFPSGLVDGGFLLLVQRFGGPDWMSPGAVPDVSGHWDGPYMQADGPGGGCIMADLQAVLNANGAPTTAFTGPLDPASGQPGPGLQLQSSGGGFSALFDVQGTVGLPAVQMGDGSLASPWGAIGISPGPRVRGNGIIAILIGLLLPAVQTPGAPPGPRQIQGNYLLFRSLQDVYVAFQRMADTSFDRGTFSLSSNPGPAQ